MLMILIKDGENIILHVRGVLWGHLKRVVLVGRFMVKRIKIPHTRNKIITIYYIKYVNTFISS